MAIYRHKVFISFCHTDEYYKEQLTKFKYVNTETGRYESIFDNYSVGNGDIDDSVLTDEQIRRIIRDDYIAGATVFILLCGERTKFRKHIDWEIHAAMYDSDTNPKMGILVINLPTISQRQRVQAATEEEKQFFPWAPGWTELTTRISLENAFPYMPERMIDNFVKQVPITVANWSDISEEPLKLMKMIDNAFLRKDTNKYDHSRPLRKKNS